MALLYNIKSPPAAGAMCYPWTAQVTQLGNVFHALQSGSSRGGGWDDPSSNPGRVIDAVQRLVAYREQP